MTDTINIGPGAVVRIDAETTQRLVSELRQAREERDAAIASTKATYATTNPTPPPAYAAALDQLRGQLEAVTAERDTLLQRFAHGHIEREIDAQVMADLKRDELADLRAQLESARQEATLAARKSAMHEQDADEARRAVAVLQAMFHAAIKAAARTP